MIRLRLRSVAVIGPGLDNWPSTQAILRGDDVFEQRPTVVPPVLRLPATERRRVGLSVKVAMAVADQLFAQASLSAVDTATLFSSSGGDGENCHILCDALDNAAPMLSPTRFTNSVHNAPSGYWSIAAGSMQPASTLCAHDASFTAGLIEAGIYASYEREPIALIAYDVPYPEPIHSKRAIQAPFAVAMILSTIDGTSTQTLPGIADLSFDRWCTGIATTMTDAGLEALRLGIPAARSLPLLSVLARYANAAAMTPNSQTVAIGALDGRVLPIRVSRCN